MKKVTLLNWKEEDAGRGGGQTGEAREGCAYIQILLLAKEAMKRPRLCQRFG